MAVLLPSYLGAGAGLNIERDGGGATRLLVTGAFAGGFFVWVCLCPGVGWALLSRGFGGTRGSGPRVLAAGEREPDGRADDGDIMRVG